MVTLTRLTGAEFALNPDLIERVDQTPDTVISLVNGTKYLVRESLHQVVDMVREYRAGILAAAAIMEYNPIDQERSLSAVPTHEAASVVRFPRGED